MSYKPRVCSSWWTIALAEGPLASPGVPVRSRSLTVADGRPSFARPIIVSLAASGFRVVHRGHSQNVGSPKTVPMVPFRSNRRCASGTGGTRHATEIRISPNRQNRATLQRRLTMVRMPLAYPTREQHGGHPNVASFVAYAALQIIRHVIDE